MPEDVLHLLRIDIYSLHSEKQRELFQSFHACVYRDIYFLLGEHALTEDAIQEAFMKAIKNGPKLRQDSNIKGWIRQIGRNTAYDMMRKNKKYRQLIDIDDVIYNDDANDHNVLIAAFVDQAVEKTLRDESLHLAILALKPEYRMVIYLHYILELSYAEISREIGVSEQVLAQRLARARRKLAAGFLEKWGCSE